MILNTGTNGPSGFSGFSGGTGGGGGSDGVSGTNIIIGTNAAVSGTGGSVISGFSGIAIGNNALILNDEAILGPGGTFNTITIGHNSSAYSGWNNFIVGTGSTISSGSANALIVGNSSFVTQGQGTAVGNNVNVNGNGSTGIGFGAIVNPGNSISINGLVNGNGQAVVIGATSQCNDVDQTVIGYNTNAAYGASGVTIIGSGSKADKTSFGPVNGVAIGIGAYLNDSGGGCCAFGGYATVKSNSFGGMALGAYSTVDTASSYSIAIGVSVRNKSSKSICVGGYATVNASSNFSIGLGHESTVVSGFNHSITMGAYSSVGGTGSISIGAYSNANNGGGTIATASICLGAYATTTLNNVAVIGSVAAPISNVYIGNGDAVTTPAGFTLNATGGSGADKTGGSIAIAGGISTGTGNGGAVRLQTTLPSTASGGTPNALIDRIFINGASKALTDATNNDLFSIPVPDLTTIGLSVFYKVTASDGIDVQVWTDDVYVQAVAKAGTVTAAPATSAGIGGATISGGTLGVTFNTNTAANLLTIGITPASSLTTTVYEVVYQIVNNSNSAITIL